MIRVCTGSILTMANLPKDDEAFACNADVEQVLDFFSYRTEEKDSFKPFNLEIQFIRDKGIECEYCTQPARWRLKEIE